MKSCTDCPSFVPADDVPVVFGKAVGAPMCKRYGHVLGRPGLSESGNETLAIAFALKCPSYGEAAPDRPSSKQAMPLKPDPKAIGRITQPDFKPDELLTCRACVNCVAPKTVASELGFATEVCKAKGKLILRPQSDCQSCPMAVAGPQATSTDGMELREEYREGYVIPTQAAVDSVTAIGNTAVEPTTYETDFPVSSEHYIKGIRAWRKINQPDGPKMLALPIFRRDFFTEEEQRKIPATGCDEHPELYVDYDHKLYRAAVNAYMRKEVVALQGPPGVGKTEFARWMAWLMQVPFERIAFNKASEVGNVTGTKEVDATEFGPRTAFHVGRTAKALERPGIVLFDEFNLAPEENREHLRTLFDTGVMDIDEASPAIHIKRNEFNLNFVAQNPAHDIRNIGAQELADAEYSRLSPLAVAMPPEPVERHILTERCKAEGYNIPPATLDIIIKVSEDLRVMSKQQTIPFTWGIRESIKWACKTNWYSLPMALKDTKLDFFDDETAQLCLKALNDHTPN